LNRKQENEVIKTYRYKELYKANLDSMFRYANKCTDALLECNRSYSDLKVSYNKLEAKATEYKNDAIECAALHKRALSDLDTENTRKRIWRRIAIGEGVFILGVGALFYFL